MKLVLVALCAIVVLVLLGARVGLFAGQAPTDLGVKEGRLKPPSPTRNSVSSQSRLYPGHGQAAYAAIEPLPLLNDDPDGSMRHLSAVLSETPGVRLVRAEPGYLRAEATTRWLRFVDDLEFWLDRQAGVIEMRSASRLGREDFGVNRQRLDNIRGAYLARRAARLEHSAAAAGKQ